MPTLSGNRARLHAVRARLTAVLTHYATQRWTAATSAPAMIYKTHCQSAGTRRAATAMPTTWPFRRESPVDTPRARHTAPLRCSASSQSTRRRKLGEAQRESRSPRLSWQVVPSASEPARRAALSVDLGAYVLVCASKPEVALARARRVVVSRGRASTGSDGFGYVRRVGRDAFVASRR